MFSTEEERGNMDRQPDPPTTGDYILLAIWAIFVISVFVVEVLDTGGGVD